MERTRAADEYIASLVSSRDKPPPERPTSLLSDLPGPARWAVKTEPYDLGEYDQFPKQFRCD